MLLKTRAELHGLGDSPDESLVFNGGLCVTQRHPILSIYRNPCYFTMALRLNIETLHKPIMQLNGSAFGILETATRHKKQARIDAPTTRQFVDEAGAMLKFEMEGIFTPLQRLTTERDRLSREIAEFSWLERWFFRFFEYHEKLSKAQQLETEIQALAAEFVRMCDLY